MANTIIIYQGDGSTTDFAVPFDYLRKSFVKVLLNSVTELKGGSATDTSADYYFVDATTIRLRKIVPTTAQTITIRRYTSVKERVASFRDGSVLYAKDLDTSQVQAFHIAEEARDVINDALVVDRDDNWDARGKRIVNVGTPVNNSDAVTYGVYKTDALGALQSKIDAEKARDRAVLAETNSKKSEENAKLSETNAKASEDTAVSASEHADAVKVENQAIIKEAREIIAEDRVLHKETKDNTTITVARADEAVLSAKNAKDSEVKAKESEEAVNAVATAVVPIAPEIKIVANNIDSVVNDSNNINNINLVGNDLTGSLSDSTYDDYGDLGNPSVPLPTITGGNIKTVADNIEAVRTVAGLAPDFDVVVDSVNTVTSLTVRAENASKSAETSASKASGHETQAQASKVSASESASLSKDWATKTDDTVDGSEYSAKYYANKAKTEGGQAVTQAVASAVQKVSDEGTKQVNLAKAEVTKATEQVAIATEKATTATSSASAAKESETNAASSANEAAASQAQASKDANTARNHSSGAQAWATLAGKNKDAAQASADAAKTSETNAASSASEATAQAERAKGYADQASTGQVQADWAETNTTAKGFIKNKPDLSGYATTTALTTGLAGKADKAHTHAISDVTGLQNALNGKLSVTTFEGFIDYGDLGTPLK